jgi:hypothetical protein
MNVSQDGANRIVEMIKANGFYAKSDRSGTARSQTDTCRTVTEMAMNARSSCSALVLLFDDFPLM